MFLNNLEKTQKQLFIDLAIKAVEANDIIEIEEKNMLKCFALEMDVQPRYKTEKGIDEILDDIVCISKIRDLKIIAFEILGILFSDGEFDDCENSFTKYMIHKFGLSDEWIEEMITLLNDYTSVYKKICEQIMK